MNYQFLRSICKQPEVVGTAEGCFRHTDFYLYSDKNFACGSIMPPLAANQHEADI